MKPSKHKIEAAASEMASDSELCVIFDLTPEALEPYRKTIEAARTAAAVHLEWERKRARANGRKV